MENTNSGISARQEQKPAWRRIATRFAAPSLFLVCGVLLIVILGLAQRVGWISVPANRLQAVGEAAAQIHTCPMHPQVRQPGPGRCPQCGMELVPVTSAKSGGGDSFSVTIQPAQRRLSNIQTETVRREPVFATIETIGAIAIDESRMATVASYVEGRLERLFADYTGVRVSPGDHLAVVYSSELYTAQVEYLESRRTLSRMATGGLAAVREAQQKLVANTRQKLVELGMQESQIAELESGEGAKSRLTIFTPIGGTVVEKLAVEGKYVNAGEPIYRIADLSTVWLMLELYPEDAARIRYGQRVEAELQSLPGETFRGRVAFVDPTVDTLKRTVGVRVEFLNGEGRLRPGDYANARIFVPVGEEGEVYDAELAGRWISPMHPQIISDTPGPCTICGMDLVPTSRYGYTDEPVERPEALVIARSAVLMAGNSSVVYVETDPGRFEIRAVTLGPILRDKVVIIQGLTAGEEIATAGNFLIDSQMQLDGKPSLIDPEKAIAAAETRKTPLQFASAELRPISGESGRQLEQLFAAYFSAQTALAADKSPTAEDVTMLVERADQLARSPEFDRRLSALFQTVAEQAEQLTQLDLEQARQDAFRPLSHAVVELASRVRGSESQRSFHHMFCPMVKGGAGDWLQDDSNLLNPYWGSQMLRCGEQVQTFPAANALQKSGAAAVKSHAPTASEEADQ